MKILGAFLLLALGSSQLANADDLGICTYDSLPIRAYPVDSYMRSTCTSDILKVEGIFTLRVNDKVVRTYQSDVRYRTIGSVTECSQSGEINWTSSYGQELYENVQKRLRLDCNYLQTGGVCICVSGALDSSK